MLAGVKSRKIISRDFTAVQSMPDTRIIQRDPALPVAYLGRYGLGPPRHMVSPAFAVESTRRTASMEQ
jgi:hypothetical protein